MGLRPLPAQDTPRLRWRWRGAVRDSRRVVAPVSEGRAVGLLLRRRDRASVQRERARGHPGQRARVRSVPAAAANALPQRFTAGLGRHASAPDGSRRTAST